MRRIINSTYMSLDGVIQRPELWTFDYRSDDAARFQHEQLFGSGALLMGRHTYEIFADHWPTATDGAGFADRMNSLPKYVVSDTLTGPTWNNTTVLARGDAADQLRKLKQQSGQDILQYGYGPVTASLMRGGMLDELRIWLHPLLVGGGDSQALLAHVGAQARLALADVARYDSGLVILRYRPSNGSPNPDEAEQPA
jgi:dihydrofolate reductase